MTAAEIATHLRQEHGASARFVDITLSELVGYRLVVHDKVKDAWMRTDLGRAVAQAMARDGAA